MNAETTIPVKDPDFLRKGHIISIGEDAFEVVAVPFRLPNWLSWLYRFRWARLWFLSNTVTVKKIYMPPKENFIVNWDAIAPLKFEDEEEP